jgi:hypothetical protein
MRIVSGIFSFNLPLLLVFFSVADAINLEKVFTITTYAGTGVVGCNGDGGPASSSQLSYPGGVALDAPGNLYFTDSGECSRIRLVTKSTGIITTYAGNGLTFNSDGGPATSSWLWFPSDVALDASGNLYIADWGSQRIRLVTKSTGIITTYAGTGVKGFNGDGRPATSSQLSPSGFALDASGNLYIADSYSQRIRLVTKSTGIITTYAGTGVEGSNGDGGPASSSQLVPVVLPWTHLAIYISQT